MLNIFTLSNGRLIQEEIDAALDHAPAPDATQPIWVDMESPTAAEKRWVREQFGLVIPDDAFAEDIEESARFYEDDHGQLNIRSDFLIADEDEPRTVRVAFVMRREDVSAQVNAPGILFSIHDEDVPVFRLLRLRARRMPGLIENAKEVLLKLYDADAEYSADTLENIYESLEAASKQVLNDNVSDELAAEVLAAIARSEDLNGRIRRNVMDTRRALSFLMRGKLLTSEQFADARQIMRDLDSLDSHTAFLFDKINFLMDATVGFININQNKIIKIFSVASVALLPPTLIASIYGMNLQIPEVQALGSAAYPFVVLLMLASAAVPMWYFRKRGWLK